MKAELVLKTIGKAIKRWRLPKGCIFHSDKGSQYTSEKLKIYFRQMECAKVFRVQENPEIMHGMKASLQT